MKRKYIDEKEGTWFIFGVYPNGNVDINNGFRDVITNVPRDVADGLCDLHSDFMERVYKITDNL